MIQNAFDRYFNKPPLVVTGEDTPKGMRRCIQCLKVMPLDMYHLNGKHPVSKQPRWRAICKGCYNEQVNEKNRRRK